MAATKLSIFLIFILFFPALFAQDFKSFFVESDGCFLIAELSSGKILKEYNADRCLKKFPPCSSFKIAASLMAFEKGILKDQTQHIKWDRIRRNRQGLNQDQ